MKNSLIIILAFFVGISVFFLGKEKPQHKMHFHGQQIGHENLKIVQPYARVSSASAKSGAIFFIIENGTNLEHKLIGATADVAKKAELQTHSVDGDGVMSMAKINDGVNIEPKSRSIFFFCQAEDGIRGGHVTGVQTCALPISTTQDAFSW